ncbi:MAG: signal peptidase II [Rhizobiaceae bacterium]|nr:MAG: signal peptidase II [Rhizobiaceae bacterium]CAG1011499.1 signal peptidase II [Rhizobiaceae bacterium]
MTARPGFLAAVFTVAVALDQWLKYLVETRLELQEKVDVLPFLALYRTFNTGIAFSMLSWFGDKGLIVVTLAVVAFILYLAWRSDPGQMFARLGFTLILGGAIGNLIDRVLYGHVVDYVLFHTPVWSFAVFNLADAFITIGAGLVILEELLIWRRGHRATPDA